MPPKRQPKAKKTKTVTPKKKSNSVSLITPTPKKQPKPKVVKPVIARKKPSADIPTDLLPVNPKSSQNPKLVKETFDKPTKEINHDVPVVNEVNNLVPSEPHDDFARILAQKKKEYEDQLEYFGEKPFSKSESQFKKRSLIVPESNRTGIMTQEHRNNLTPQLYSVPYKLLEEGKISPDEFRRLVNEAKGKTEDVDGYVKSKLSHLFSSSQ